MRLLPVAITAAVVVSLISWVGSRPPGAGSCEVGGVRLSIEQSANAATIAAVGRRIGLPDRAVTIALATALQESDLRNLDHGDRDSLGVFQQRPSQGWGSPAQVQDPAYAAGAFYAHLATVPDWPQLALTDAAQAVQRSAFPTAYAQWEARADTLAVALGGAVQAVSCSYGADSAPGPAGTGPAGSGPAAATAEDELGLVPTTQGAVLTFAAGDRPWATASWLVAHAQGLDIAEVIHGGAAWTPAGGWQAAPAGADVVLARLG